MDGRVIPDGYGALASWPLNLFENIAAVQFNHRLLALTSLAAALALWVRSRRVPGEGKPAAGLRGAFDRIALLALLQVGLGIWTLLAVVPVWLGALHQAGAILLLTATLDALHRVHRPARS